MYKIFNYAKQKIAREETWDYTVVFLEQEIINPLTVLPTSSEQWNKISATLTRVWLVQRPVLRSCMQGR